MTDHVTATPDVEAELAALRKRVGELEAVLAQRRPLWEAVGSDEAHYKAAFDNVADAIVINVGRQRVLMNRAFLALHGLTDESEVSGVPLDHFVVPEDRPIIGDYMAARERGEPVPGVFRYRIKRSDSEVRMVEATAVATAFLGRRATFAVLRDVTERSEAEEEARRRSEEAAALYTMAHALAQPGSYTERVTSLLEALVDLTRADQVGLRVPDQSGEGLVVLAVVGPAVGGDRQHLLPYAQSVTGKAFTQGEPVIVNDYRNSDMAIPTLLDRGIGSMASLPVQVTGRIIGVINILSSLPDHFTRDRVRFLTTIAGALERCWKTRGCKKRLNCERWSWPARTPTWSNSPTSLPTIFRSRCGRSSGLRACCRGAIAASWMMTRTGSSGERWPPLPGCRC